MAAFFDGAWVWSLLIMVFLVGTFMYSHLPAFWPIPTIFLGGAAAASAIGFVNMIGNLGGSVGPIMVGKAVQGQSSYAPRAVPAGGIPRHRGNDHVVDGLPAAEGAAAGERSPLTGACEDDTAAVLRPVVPHRSSAVAGKIGRGLGFPRGVRRPGRSDGSRPRGRCPGPSVSPASPSSHFPSLPSSLADIVLSRGSARSPDDRPVDMAERVSLVVQDPKETTSRSFPKAPYATLWTLAAPRTSRLGFARGSRRLRAEGAFAHRGYYLTLTRTPTFGLDAWKKTVDAVMADGGNLVILWTAGGFKSKKFPATWCSTTGTTRTSRRTSSAS